MNNIAELLLETPTIALIPVFLIVINQVLIQKFEMETRLAIIVNQVLSIFLVVTATWGEIELLKALLVAMLLGFASSGLYDVKKLFA